MLRLEVLTGPQGGGKTSLMCQEAADRKGRYLFAAPLIELLDEIADTLRAKGMPEVCVVHSESKGKGTTLERLAHAREDIMRRGVPRAAILTTHETLMAADLSGYQGWHARIDEAPAAVQAGRLDVRTLRDWFKANFRLDGPPGSEWASLSFIGDRDGSKTLRAPSMRDLAEFRKQARVPGRVFVNASNWDDASEAVWFSMWTPLELHGFATVQIAGTSYTDSVGFKAARAIFADRFSHSERKIGEGRTKQPNISIHYFTRGHRGAITYWNTSDGRIKIKAVCDYLGRTLKGGGVYWSGNEVVQHLMEHRVPGLLIKPTASGLNRHRHLTTCAFIFSAKPTKDDVALHSAFGLSADDIRKGREDDAIAQFAMRGAIRNSTYEGPYDIYLYEEGQANRLRDHLFTRGGFTNVSVIEIEEAGILNEKRKPAKAPVHQPTPAEIAAKKVERNKKAKVRMQAVRARKKKACAAP